MLLNFNIFFCGSNFFYSLEGLNFIIKERLI